MLEGDNVRNRKRRKLIIMATLIILLAFISASYAVLAPILKISNASSQVNNFNVEFTNLTLESEGGQISGKISDSRKNIVLNVNDLNSPGSEVIAHVTVKNKGNIDANLKEIIATGDIDDENISLIYPKFVKKVLEPESTYYFPITIKWKNDSVKLSNSISFSFELLFEQSSLK